MFTSHFLHTAFMLNRIVLAWNFTIVPAAPVASRGSTFLAICSKTNMIPWYMECVLLTTGFLGKKKKTQFYRGGGSFKINENSWYQSSAICKRSVHMAPICSTSATPHPHHALISLSPPTQTISQRNFKRNSSGETSLSHSLVKRRRRSFGRRDEGIKGGELRSKVDGELDWWDQLSDKGVMNAGVGGRKEKAYKSELEEKWMKRPRKTVWWRKLGLMESHWGKSC